MEASDWCKMRCCNMVRRVVLAILLAALAAASVQAQSPLKSTKFVPGSWSLVLLPDTQYYSQQFPGLFTLQTHWIAKNKDRYNIRYVLGLGDITDKNSRREWRRAQDAISELDGRVPYALASGNHDYTPNGDSASGKSGMSEFFSAGEVPEMAHLRRRDDARRHHE